MRCGAQAESAAGSWEATAAPPGLAVKRQGAAGSPGGGNGAGWRDVRGVPVGAGQGPAHRVKERVAASGSSRSSAATRRLAGSQRVQHGVRGDELARAAMRGRQAHTDRGDDHLVTGSRGQGASEQVKDVIGHRGARATYSGRHASARIGRSEPNRSQARSNSAWPANRSAVEHSWPTVEPGSAHEPRNPQGLGKQPAARQPRTTAEADRTEDHWPTRARGSVPALALVNRFVAIAHRCRGTRGSVSLSLTTLADRTSNRALPTSSTSMVKYFTCAAVTLRPSRRSTVAAARTTPRSGPATTGPGQRRPTAVRRDGDCPEARRRTAVASGPRLPASPGHWRRDGARLVGRVRLGRYLVVRPLGALCTRSNRHRAAAQPPVSSMELLRLAR